MPWRQSYEDTDTEETTRGLELNPLQSTWKGLSQGDEAALVPARRFVYACQQGAENSLNAPRCHRQAGDCGIACLHSDLWPFHRDTPDLSTQAGYHCDTEHQLRLSGPLLLRPFRCCAVGGFTAVSCSQHSTAKCSGQPAASKPGLPCAGKSSRCSALTLCSATIGFAREIELSVSIACAFVGAAE